jgi:hypothetical protein
MIAKGIYCTCQLAMGMRWQQYGGCDDTADDIPEWKFSGII